MLIQHGKEKIRELKIRSLVPPSQRYHQSTNAGNVNRSVSVTPKINATHFEGTTRLDSERCTSFISEASHHMGNLAKDQQFDAAGKRKGLFSLESSTKRVGDVRKDQPIDTETEMISSFISEASHQIMGNLTKDHLFDAAGKRKRSFDSEFTKRVGNATKDRLGGDSLVDTNDAEPKCSFDSKFTRHAGDLKRVEATHALEISYDSFAEHDSDDFALARGNTLPSIGHGSSAMGHSRTGTSTVEFISKK